MGRERSTYLLRAHKGAMHSMSVKAGTPSGRWGGFMKASAYIGGLVVVDGATVQCDCARADVDATSRLPEGGKHGTSAKASTPSGRWGGFVV